MSCLPPVPRGSVINSSGVMLTRAAGPEPTGARTELRDGDEGCSSRAPPPVLPTMARTELRDGDEGCSSRAPPPVLPTVAPPAAGDAPGPWIPAALA